MREVLSGALTAPQGEIRELAERQETGETEDWILSTWTLAHFCCEEIHTMLRGAWSRDRKQQCQAHVQRYVRSHQRKRGHCESEQRAWLREHFFPLQA